MLTETSTRLIARYYNETSSQPDVAKACEVADEILTPDFIFHPPNDREGQHGLERHKQFLVWHHGVAPDQQYTIEDVVADSSRASVRWSLRGTHRGEFLGIPPTGRNFRLVGIDYLYVTDDKIAELWRSFDIQALIQQLTSDLAEGEAMYSHKHELEYLCSFNTGLTPPENIGLLAEGHRITGYHTGWSGQWAEAARDGTAGGRGLGDLADRWRLRD